MKKLLTLILILPLYLFSFDYATQWKEIESLNKQALPKSALKKVELIYETAITQNKPIEFIRATLYKKNYLKTLNKDGIVMEIKFMEKAINEATKAEVKLILTSVLAELYANYLDKRYYKIRNRTNLKQNLSTDIDTWTIEQLKEKTSTLYLKSIKALTKTIEMKKYQNILTKGKHIEGLYPTLYDFLAFRALNYFKNSRYSLRKFNQDFKLKPKDAFSSAEIFRRYPFVVNDSLKYNALLIYQKLLNFHKEGQYPDAQMHIDLERLFFVSNNLTDNSSNENHSYEKALKNIISQNPQSEALYFLADFYVNKNDHLNAMKYAKKGINSNNQYTKKLSLAIKNNLEERSLRLTMEEVNLAHENILAALHYRNINTLFIKVLKINNSELDKFSNIQDEAKKLNYVKTLKTVKDFHLTLQQDIDYQEHGTEVSLGAYDLGKYLFLFSNKNDFSQNISYQSTQISNIAHLAKNNKLLVLNRKLGTPLQNVKASFYTTNNKYEVLAFSKVSDVNGFIDLPKEYTQNYRNHKVIFEHNNDSLTTNVASRRHYSRNKQTRKSVYFFTDRGIYRPSQTLYFKGLAVESSSNKKPKVLSNKIVTVTFLNKNHQKIDAKEFKTDEYGTFHGEFRTPSSGLLGVMQLKSSIGGNAYVHVEEYKRPKFEVTFNKLDKSYVLGDNITFRGNAKAYAGNGIDGATVKYTVKREARFPWRCYWEPMPHNYSKTIKKGKVTTNSKGLFSIDFDALKEDSLDDKSPNYYYTINVDVTDTTGETHGSSKSIELGTVGIKASIVLASELNIEDNKTLTLRTSNLDGKFQSLQGEIVVKKQANKKRLYKERYWGMYRLDKPIYGQDEFTKLFPNYEFFEKGKKEQEKVIKNIPFDTNISKEVDLGVLQQGEYILTLNTSDKNGIKVSSSKKLTVYDLHSKQPHITSNLWHKNDKKHYKVGEDALINIKSSHKDLAILLSIERNSQPIQEKWISLSGLYQALINIKPSDQGNINYQINFVKENRAYSKKGTIRVPWDTELKVEYLSFRDKLKPNEEEQWKVKISGQGKEKLMAQMVATMYDASLDALATHNFHFPNLYSNLHRDYTKQWRKENGFSQTWLDKSWLLQKVEHTQRIYQDIRWKNSNALREETYDDSAGYGASSYPESARSAAKCGKGGDINPVTVFEQEPVMLKAKKLSNKVTIRKNLKETMFFKPNLQTDKDGNIIINFKTNEALTRWNFMAFVHTKDLKTAVTKKTLTTAKELMVVTNLPRFFREKDSITLSAKVVNMSDKDQNGTCELQLVNAVTEQPIFEQKFIKNISLKKGASAVVEFKITVPDVDKIPTIKHTIIAKTATHSDAEQVVKPILSNRVFVTESKNMFVKAHEKKEFTLESLKRNTSTSLSNHKLTLEFTSNPAWYAIKSLPYLMEYPHECNEQLFNRYFANAIAAKIANSSPKIKEVFESWKSKEELQSALSTNAELKSVLLEETPWVLNAKSQAEQQANVGIIFDLVRLAKEEEETYNKLIKRQFKHKDGGWAWFESPHSNWYITQYIVEGFGKLKKLGIDKTNTEAMGVATHYMDVKMLEAYKKMLKNVEKGHGTVEDDHLSSMLIHYLYARSFYSFNMGSEIQSAHDYYLEQAKKYWTTKGLYEQGMIALTLNAKNDKKSAMSIVNSLKERALVSDELGMYYKYNNGYYWNQMPIETHALMIEVFNDIANDKKSVELLKTWLLKNKQTTHWKTTKATASAVYALLFDNNWLESKAVNVSFSNKPEHSEQIQKATKQAGTGYFKIDFDEVEPSMATVKVDNPNDNIAWGALYWQYFEDMDKVKNFKETPLTIDKKLYLIQNGQSGEILSPIENQALHVGDKVKVRIEIRVDRDMEFVMLKDARASAFEPLNVLSRYKYQDGLGYYQSTKDNATYFFMDYLRKGTYVFEYPLVVTHKGEFSNGITTMESMYAPEFKSHSEGVRILVE